MQHFGAGTQGAAELLHLLQKLHANRKETDMQLKKGNATEMNKRTSWRDATPPQTGGVPNERGYQEDQPRDTASATCCALLRPLPEERQPGSNPRFRVRNAPNRRFTKR